jgi:hypothetical protein
MTSCCAFGEVVQRSLGIHARTTPCIRAHQQGRALYSSEKNEDQEDDKDES